MEALGVPQVPVSSMGMDPEVMAAQLRSGNRQALDSASANFESMFLSLVMKEMRQTLEEGTMFGEDSADVYGGLFDMFLGQHLAQGGGLGVARMVKQQLDPSRKP